MIKNIKLLIVIAVAVISAVPMHAHKVMADIFARESMDNVVPYIDKVSRMDMIDYFDGGYDTPSHDTMYQGDVRITLLEDRTMQLRAGNLTVDLTLVTAGRDSLLTVVQSYPLRGGDADVSVYSLDGQRMESAFKAPEYADWLVSGATDALPADVILGAVPFVTYTAAVDCNTGVVTLTNTALAEGLDSNIAEQFKPSLRYGMKGKRYVLLP